MPKQTGNIISSYLDKFGEQEHVIAIELTEKNYQHCLVIPCFNEQWETLKQVWENMWGSWLIILVINAPPGLGQSGKKLLADICSACQPISQKGNISLQSLSESIDLMTVDRCSSPLEIALNKGVGHARKIGADIALSLIHQGLINVPLIFNSDADVELPCGYGNSYKIMETADFSAAIYPFEHSLAENKTAILLYEISLYYYQLSLMWAGSPYALNALGSTLVINADYYARVRGFPKRNAAEDFYVTNKLAKIGTVIQLTAPVVKIQSRFSDRVPFGTGAALGKINEMGDPESEYLFYHPQLFKALRHFLTLQSKLWGQSNVESLLIEIPPDYQELIRSWIKASGMDQVLKKRRGGIKTTRVFEKFLHDWFDGFRTLKFIHYARDNFFPSIPLQQLLDQNPVFAQASVEKSSSLESIRASLAKEVQGFTAFINR